MTPEVKRQLESPIEFVTNVDSGEDLGRRSQLTSSSRRMLVAM
jgi:hypothetical protein